MFPIADAAPLNAYRKTPTIVTKTLTNGFIYPLLELTAIFTAIASGNFSHHHLTG
jgi:hypothetical protein